MYTLKVILICVLSFITKSAGSDYTLYTQGDVDPDLFKNVSEMIRSKGYPVEEYELITPDGYILGLQRIPNGRGWSEPGGPAVLLHHGLFTNGGEFVANFPDQTLGFILADSGYDVWITNVRGTRYSKKHVSLSTKSPEYWNFSWDEMALVDLPVTIDYILNATNQEKLYYVGHSMGTTVLFALLSDKPEYNSKVRVAVQMAPVALGEHSQATSFVLLKYLKDAEIFLNAIGHGELIPNTYIVDFLTVVLCEEDIQACYDWATAATGMSKKQLNMTRIPVYLSGGPDGSSVHTVLHYGQLVRTPNFRKYDFGPKGNMIKYNQPTPPEYALEKITAPMVLMWGLNDQTADPVDVNLLALRLKSLVLNYQVPYPEWSHNDFAIGLDANRFVYQEVLNQFSKF